MVLAVIVTVTILALVVSGYWISSDFKVERQGMLQIYSTPTGANVNIDGETSSWLQRTNTSKVLASGEHTVTLSKEGYDSWSKTINIREGLLYRLHYPRLFLSDRTPEKILNTTGTTHAFISASHDSIMLTNNTTKWKFIDLKADKIEPKTLDISKYFSSVSLAENSNTGLFDGDIVDANWDYDANHILFKVKNDDHIEWALIDVNNIDKSINLSKEFGGDFSKVEILDNSSNNLLVIQNGNLHKIDVSGRLISAVLAENVINFDHFNNEVVFSASSSSTQNNTAEIANHAEYYIGYFKVGDNKISKLNKSSSPAKVLLSKFYDKKYITVIEEATAIVYEKEDFKMVKKYELDFVPQKAEVGRDGEFIIMYEGDKIATIDMEAGELRVWNIEGETFGWLDNDMIYTVKDGELITYDFDGLNRRVLAKNASSHFPAGITDNKWLYYFSDNELIREVISE